MRTKKTAVLDLPVLVSCNYSDQDLAATSAQVALPDQVTPTRLNAGDRRQAPASHERRSAEIAGAEGDRSMRAVKQLQPGRLFDDCRWKRGIEAIHRSALPASAQSALSQAVRFEARPGG
ncbi:hypothetical protein XH87_00435 [Bradyrhizobium sp. CCBAU 53415]|nr:hypothetical protein [Bradyrhizobium sp. CCBAU 53415]